MKNCHVCNNVLEKESCRLTATGQHCWQLVNEKKFHHCEVDSRPRKRVFISFAVEDSDLWEFVILQAKNRSAPFEFVDMSVKEPWGSEWKTECRTKIKGCDGILIIVTRNTANARGQLWEIKCAQEESVPRHAIWGYSDEKPSALPDELHGVHIANWTYDNIVNWVETL